MITVHFQYSWKTYVMSSISLILYTLSSDELAGPILAQKMAEREKSGRARGTAATKRKVMCAPTVILNFSCIVGCS